MTLWLPRSFIRRREREAHRDLIWNAGYAFEDRTPQFIGWTSELVFTNKNFNWRMVE